MKKPSRAAVETLSEPMRDLAALPAPARALREKILAACATGDIEALRIPIDWNELRPLFERGARRPAGADPIETLKSLSFDRAGREMLSIARAVLSQPFLRITRGPFESYEWPAFARRPAPPASEEEALALWACVRFADLAASNADGRPKVMRIGVGADGVWHYFWNAD
ncbi:hypothetical protein [Methylosinus sp. RM1]|uniref:hypothetical protein n=1 Tax=Methylosinus sp. RM1 TaxID=2583817 RepID=UPI00351A737B